MKTVILDRETLGADLDISVPFDTELIVFENTKPYEVVDRISDADIIFLNKVILNEENLSKAKKLKLICEAATGYDNIDIDYCRKRGIAVCNVPGYSTYSVSQVSVAMVMSLANNGLNEAIVVSPLLEDYIRKNYPKYKITSSTCKRLNEPELLEAELERDYHIVVVDYDLNNKFDILEKLPNKDKCEILVNACCLPNCPRRSLHYQSIGEQQIAYCEHIRRYPGVPFNPTSIIEKTLGKDFHCPSMDKTFFELREQSTNVSPDAIWEKYVPMGFSQFKIEGRTSGTLNLMEIYLYYMIKPECRDEARFRLLDNMSRSGVITINE